MNALDYLSQQHLNMMITSYRPFTALARSILRTPSEHSNLALCTSSVEAGDATDLFNCANAPTFLRWTPRL